MYVRTVRQPKHPLIHTPQKEKKGFALKPNFVIGAFWEQYDIIPA